MVVKHPNHIFSKKGKLSHYQSKKSRERKTEKRRKRGRIVRLLLVAKAEVHLIPHRVLTLSQTERGTRSTVIITDQAEEMIAERRDIIKVAEEMNVEEVEVDEFYHGYMH